MIKNKIKIILASSSLRRKELLKAIGLKYSSVKSTIEDQEKPILNYKNLPPYKVAITLAHMKANDVSKKIKDKAVIIAADTIVVIKNRIIGKPSSKEDAAKMLKLLSGKTHRVITGLCVLKVPEYRESTFYVETTVTMAKMTARDIEWYVKTGEPLDKAGAYGIQGLGGLFIKKISGSYTNVVGLPVPELIATLRKLGVIELV
jgi:septum formation protein